MIKQIHKYIVFGLLIVLIACNSSEEEPCPQYPARYISTIDENTTEIIGLYQYMDGTMINREDQIEEVNDYFDNSSPQFSGLSIVGELVLVSDSSIDFIAFNEDRSDSLKFSYDYSQLSDGVYRLDLTSQDVVDLIVSISDDCRHIELCYLVETQYHQDRDITDATQTDRSEYCQGKITIEELASREFPEFEEEDYLAYWHFYMRFVLVE